MKSFRTGPTSFARAALLAVVLLTYAAAPTHAQGLGSEAYEAALSYRDAVHGNADAQADLGSRFAKGLGMPQSDEKAVRWLTRAANQGHAAAQLMLAELLAAGRGGPDSDVAAYKWAFLAAVYGAAGPVHDNAVSLAVTLSARMGRGKTAEARRLIDRWRAQPEERRPPPAVQKAAAPESSREVAETEPDATGSTVRRRHGARHHDRHGR
jgi:TPR repeat protein